ncbi:MAG: FAD-dependent oxidoreductase, partial [Bdellovibrionales bacterium]|nr:FAD-dependent oxidoreductase [Bdellovibrionales bacterium]
KAILQSAKIAYEVDSSHAYGVNVDLKTKSVDFQKVMALVQDKIRAIEPHDSIERYTSLGVECLTGRAKLKSPWEIEVTDAQKKTRVVTARSIVVATGAAPIVPDIEGLRECGPLTSETLWQLKELPKKLMVLGGGPIGCELALAFSRLGAEVTLIERGASILSREDLEVSALLQKSLEKNGVRVKLKTNIVRFEAPGPFQKGEAAPKRALTEAGDRLEFDQVLVALGRRARTSGLGLEQLGIEVENNGTISRSETLQTSMPNIFVCGDVAGPWQFTHTAAHQAWYAAVNALVDPFWSFKVDERVIPAVTYTDPEIARVGLNEREATEKGIDFEVTRYDLDDLDRAIVDSKAEGFVKVLTPPNSDQILGATIVGAHAGELLAEFTLAMKHGLGLGKILGTIHPYPTYSEASKYTAGVWRKAHAPQAALKFAAAFFNFRRS